MTQVPQVTQGRGESAGTTQLEMCAFSPVKCMFVENKLSANLDSLHSGADVRQ